jgi:hypothetical protein
MEWERDDPKPHRSSFPVVKTRSKRLRSVHEFLFEQDQGQRVPNRDDRARFPEFGRLGGLTMGRASEPDASPAE